MWITPLLDCAEYKKRLVMILLFLYMTYSSRLLYRFAVINVFIRLRLIICSLHYVS